MTMFAFESICIELGVLPGLALECQEVVQALKDTKGTINSHKVYEAIVDNF